MDVVKPRYYSRWNSLYWIGIPLVIFLLFGAFFLRYKLKENEIFQVRSVLQSASLVISSPIKNALEQYIEVMQRMSKRWVAEGGTPMKLWYADASNYFNDAKIFQSLEWVDNQMRSQWVVSAANDKKARGLNLTALPSGYQTLELAKKTRQPTISKVFDLNKDTKGFLIIVPLFTEKNFDGYIVGVVNVDKLFHVLFRDYTGNNYDIAVYQNNNLVFVKGVLSPNNVFISEKMIQFYNMKWNVFVWPTIQALKKQRSLLPDLILASGMTATILILIIFYFYNQSRVNFLKMAETKRYAEQTAERLHRIMMTMNEGFISFDRNGTLTDWNPYAEKILGWTKAEALGKNVYDLVIPARNRNRNRIILDNYIKTGDAKLLNRELEFKAVKRDGREFPVEVVMIPLKFDNVYSFHALIRDISARKKAELDQARLTAIIEASEDAIISADLNGKIMTWNRGAEKLYAYKAEEVIGQSVSVIYPDDQKEELDKIIKRVISGEYVQNFDSARKHKDGHLIPVSVVISPIRGVSGKVIGGSSITRDITELKKIDRMKNEFISIVSHELRTPLTSVRGSLGLLANDKICHLSDQAKQLLEIANNNCERLIRLINDILDIQKIEEGKMVFKMKLLDLNQLILETVEEARGLDAKYNVKLEFTAEADCLVMGDYDRLKQVMTNLLSNAIRYSPKHDVVKIKTELLSDKIRVSVLDRGPGIPSDFQSKIFGKFAQADSSTTRVKSGTGLGLNICKGIVEKHQGSIFFTSTPGVGTTFYFELPLSSVNHGELI